MKSKSAKTLSWVLIVLGIVMIIAAMVLVVYNKQESDSAGEASEMALTQLEDIIFNLQNPGEAGDAGFAFSLDLDDSVSDELLSQPEDMQ